MVDSQRRRRCACESSGKRLRQRHRTRQQPQHDGLCRVGQAQQAQRRRRQRADQAGRADAQHQGHADRRARSRVGAVDARQRRIGRVEQAPRVARQQALVGLGALLRPAGVEGRLLARQAVVAAAAAVGGHAEHAEPGFFGGHAAASPAAGAHRAALVPASFGAAVAGEDRSDSGRVMRDAAAGIHAHARRRKYRCVCDRHREAVDSPPRRARRTQSMHVALIRCSDPMGPVADAEARGEAWHPLPPHERGVHWAVARRRALRYSASASVDGADSGLPVVQATRAAEPVARSDVNHSKHHRRCIRRRRRSCRRCRHTQGPGKRRNASTARSPAGLGRPPATPTLPAAAPNLPTPRQEIDATDGRPPRRADAAAGHAGGALAADILGEAGSAQQPSAARTSALQSAAEQTDRRHHAIVTAVRRVTSRRPCLRRAASLRQGRGAVAREAAARGVPMALKTIRPTCRPRSTGPARAEPRPAPAMPKLPSRNRGQGPSRRARTAPRPLPVRPDGLDRRAQPGARQPSRRRRSSCRIR